MNQKPEKSPGSAIFKRIIWALKRYFRVIIGCILFGILLSYLFIAFVPPKYKASAQLLFDPSTEQFMKAEPGFLPGILTVKALERAIALIQSSAILKQVGLRLISDPTLYDSTKQTPVKDILFDTTVNDDVRLRQLIAVLQRIFRSRLRPPINSLSSSTNLPALRKLPNLRTSSPSHSSRIARRHERRFFPRRLIGWMKGFRTQKPSL